MMEVKGRHVLRRRAQRVHLCDQEIREALAEPLRQIVQAVRDSLEKHSAGTVRRHLRSRRRVDRRRRDAAQSRQAPAHETGLPVLVAENPLTSVVVGAGMILSDLPLLRRVAWQ